LFHEVGTSSGWDFGRHDRIRPMRQTRLNFEFKLPVTA
jgi:hypothetical protein